MILKKCSMDNGLIFPRFCHVHIKQLLFLAGILAAILAFPNLFIFSNKNVGFISLSTGSDAFSNNSKLVDSDHFHGYDANGHGDFSSDVMGHKNDALEMEDRNLYHGSTFETEGHENTQNKSAKTKFAEKSIFSLAVNLSLAHNDKHNINNSHLLKVGSISSTDISVRKRRGKAISITQMNSILLSNYVEKKSKRLRLSSGDQELQNAKFQIQNAPLQRDISDVHSSVFRNYSMFKRSYELMETKLKVYIYREGKQPIFHEPYMRGIYASEGWFMKLMERNKQYVVKDPKRAHLFFLPFSSVKLRNATKPSGFLSQKDMENQLKKYVDVIATKYHFWDKRVADHFFVACHDWAPRVTRKIFENCTRVLCNSNIAGGFKIGKDVSLPVTYVRSSENPLKDIGGNPFSNRPILAFFAGGMHGYVRPMLLQYWKNKESDMRIMGPMPRDVEGKARYREFMKSSKYCICAKGYEVHTPRVVESIYYECVPVIISDNYVAPFFEVLNWESFALFVLEDDIPNLRNILLSIPEDRYIMMRERLKIVQRYFLWHKTPEKYDLFHMILHSVWYNRVFKVSS